MTPHLDDGQRLLLSQLDTCRSTLFVAEVRGCTLRELGAQLTQIRELLGVSNTAAALDLARASGWIETSTSGETGEPTK